MKKYFGTWISAGLAGICIALGGTVFLRLKDAFVGGNVVGALLFSIGLFTICTRGFHLFTGKACYLPDNGPSYVITLIVIWIGNICGCALIAAIESLTGIAGGDAGLKAVAQGLVQAKMSSSYLSLFFLGALCNIFIFIAVDGYKNNPHTCGKYLALFLGVSVFILCGTEHSVADMYYWACSGILYSNPGQSLLRLLVISIGNVCGGVSIPLLEKAVKKLGTF